MTAETALTLLVVFTIIGSVGTIVYRMRGNGDDECIDWDAFRTDVWVAPAHEWTTRLPKVNVRTIVTALLVASAILFVLGAVFSTMGQESDDVLFTTWCNDRGGHITFPMGRDGERDRSIPGKCWTYDGKLIGTEGETGK